MRDRRRREKLLARDLEREGMDSGELELQMWDLLESIEFCFG